MSIYVFFSAPLVCELCCFRLARIFYTKSCTSIYTIYTPRFYIIFISSAPIYIFLFSLSVWFCFVDFHYKLCPGYWHSVFSFQLDTILFSSSSLWQSSSTEIVNSTVCSWNIKCSIGQTILMYCTVFLCLFGSVSQQSFVCYAVTHHHIGNHICDNSSWAALFGSVQSHVCHICTRTAQRAHTHVLYAFVLWVLWLHVNQRNYTNDS